MDHDVNIDAEFREHLRVMAEAILEYEGVKGHVMGVKLVATVKRRDR